MRGRIYIQLKPYLCLIAISNFLLPYMLMAQSDYLYNNDILYVNPGELISIPSNFINKSSGVFTNNGEVVIKGNFHNEGITTFTQGLDGYIRFNGTKGTQEIAGTVGVDFKHVIFDNPNSLNAFYLSGDIHIFGEANFHRGIVDNFNYGGQIIFEQDAHALNVSDRSYVNGEVRKYGVNSFQFPIGKQGMYRPAGIIQLGKHPTYISAEYYAYNSNNLYPHSNIANSIVEINNKEFWSFKNIDDFGKFLVQISWDDRITPYSLTLNYDNLSVVAWDAVNNLWIDLGGAIDATNNVITSVWEGQAYMVFTLAIVNKTDSKSQFMIYNAVNPNDIGGNEYFRIVGIEKFPDNWVRIYNSAGFLVYETSNYDTNNNVFRGISQGEVSVQQGENLPMGSYFYIVDYMVPSTGEVKYIQGYLYLIR